MEVRLATPQDAEELLEIYRYYVEHTAITFEYETPSITEFRQRIKQTLKRYPYLAAVDGHGKIVGYAYASSFKNRAAYDLSLIHILLQKWEQQRLISFVYRSRIHTKQLLLEAILHVDMFSL